MFLVPPGTRGEVVFQVQALVAVAPAQAILARPASAPTLPTLTNTRSPAAAVNQLAAVAAEVLVVQIPPTPPPQPQLQPTPQPASQLPPSTLTG